MSYEKMKPHIINWRARHPEKYKAYLQKWREKNKEKIANNSSDPINKERKNERKRNRYLAHINKKTEKRLDNKRINLEEIDKLSKLSFEEMVSEITKSE